MMKKKAFDCVDMMHEGQAILNRKLAAMSPQEQREYWRKRTEELRNLQRQIRRQQRLSQG